VWIAGAVREEWTRGILAQLPIPATGTEEPGADSQERGQFGPLPSAHRPARAGSGQSAGVVAGFCGVAAYACGHNMATRASSWPKARSGENQNSPSHRANRPPSNSTQNTFAKKSRPHRLNDGQITRPSENYSIRMSMAHSVLIVEDDPRFREAFAAAVRGAGDLRLVGVADNLSEGLRQLDALEPDVLLVDLGLPGGSGIELIHRAEERLPQCESMVVTIFGDDESVLRCIQAGATGYLLKDAREIDIVQQIRLLCSGGSPISPAIARRLLARVGGRACPQAVSDPSSVCLSPQEQSVLTMSAKGYNYEEMAGLMGVSRHTVGTYVKRIYRKLQVHSKTEAVYEARKLGWIGD
jgi:DNA-binding NarL/FixJ family response regulator